MSLERNLARIIDVPALQPGFAGPGHQAAQVVSPDQFAAQDPFFFLMDDHIDRADGPVGGAHPHAGFETVTLLLEGGLRDRYEGGELGAGDLQWMTAGRGIVHSESVESKGKVRLLQLWLILPKAERWTDPGFQDVRLDSVPVLREPGVEVRLYSGSWGELRSSTRNHVPVTIADLQLGARASVVHELPASYNGFLFALEGEARVGAARLTTNQVGWLDRPAGEGTSTLRLSAGDAGARVLLYAGQPQNAAIVSHGPFIGDSREDIVRLYREYQAGRFARMSELVRAAHQAG